MQCLRLKQAAKEAGPPEVSLSPVAKLIADDKVRGQSVGGGGIAGKDFQGAAGMLIDNLVLVGPEYLSKPGIYA